MIKKILNKYAKKYLSARIILLFDLIIVFILYIFSFFLRYQFNFKLLEDENYGSIGWNGLIEKSLFVTGIYGAYFLYFKPYCNILRNTTPYEIYVILRSCFLTILTLSLFSIGLDLLYKKYLIHHRGSFLYLPQIVSIIHCLFVINLLLIYRIVIKKIFSKYVNNKSVNQIKVIIYGAGSSGRITMNVLKNDARTNYNIIGFIDDDPNKANKKIDQYTIFKPAIGFEKIVVKKVDQMIIAIQDLKDSKKREIINRCLKLNIEVKNVPPIHHWIEGKLTAHQIRPVKVEDLLGRVPIKLNNQNISNEINKKIVLVSGAAGSIGSEMVRQLIHFEPRKIIAIDQAESLLYDLQTEIKINYSELFYLIEFIVANINDREHISKLFKQYKPDIVYHSAAYKHVPLMEQFPFEAFYTNILGTKKLADLALENHCIKFVMISTDKAVNPTNVMGASKRIAEIYIRSLQKEYGKTQFITTRFGNVLGSNGSVIPLFRKQIEKGGPVTLTHKDITRYFMTISEACNLVLEASAMGKGREIFVFDMGKRIKIYDLAVNIIKLSGFEPFKDIDIKEIGLRPGEKLYEELLHSEENTLPTHHPKILKAKVEGQDYKIVNQLIAKMQNLSREEEFQLITFMKVLVPEYKSNNSRFEKIDQKKKI